MNPEITAWKHFNVHYHLKDNADNKRKVCLIALSKEDAKTTFENYARNDSHGMGIPQGALLIKVIGPLGMHATTPKQHLSHMYRMCIGAAKMAQAGIQRTNSPFGTATNDAVRHGTQFLAAKDLALKQASKLQRDIKDMFIRAGLNIK